MSSDLFIKADGNKHKLNHSKEAKFSKKFREELQKYSLKKYMPVSAKVQFIAAWSNDRHPEPLPVVLADIVLKKNGDVRND